LSRKRSWTVLQPVGVAMILLLAASLALASCGGSPAAPGSSASTAASGSVSSLAGEWVPAKGSLAFDVSGDGSGVTWDPHAAKPAGGLIVVDNGGSYHVTLVSADGKRYAAAAATPQGQMLLVRLIPSKFSTRFFLSSHGDRAAQLIPSVEGSPYPKAWVIDLTPGTLLEGEQ
jgi:hypothetical protein